MKIVKNQHMSKALSNGVHISLIQFGQDEGGLLQSLTTHAPQVVVPNPIDQLLHQ